MWLIFHFVFMYFCQPSAWFHVIAMVGFIPLIYINTRSLSWSDVTPCIALAAMYVGFYFTQELYHFSYLPWWVTTICGFRKKRYYILFGGVLLGTLLLIINSVKITIGHCMMNLGRMMKIKQASMASFAITHLSLASLFYYTGDFNSNIYVDILAGLSAVISACWKDNMNWFSIVMLFTHPFSTGLCIIHASNLFWYDYYKNNHYRKVKYSFHFIFPIMIVIVFVARKLVLSAREVVSVEVNIPSS
jgi:hypothetical protein